MEVIKSICNHVAVIDKGKLVTKGTLDEIISDKEHPIIKQFITFKTMNIPQSISKRLQEEAAAGLFPLIEIELNGNIPFEELLSVVYSDYKIPYKLITADVEYMGKANFGKCYYTFRAIMKKIQKLSKYFNQNNIQNTIKGYA